MNSNFTFSSPQENKNASPPADAEGPYRYYLLGEVTPVRIKYNDKGRPSLAEAPDPKFEGALKINNVLMSRITSSPEVQDITREQFVELCQRAALKKNHDGHGIIPKLQAN